MTSKALKEFKDQFKRAGQVQKLWSVHTPGSTIFPRGGKVAQNVQMRFDAKEVTNGKKRIALQVNANAKTPSLVNFIRGNSTHADLAVIDINMNEPKENREKAFDDAFDLAFEQAKAKLG